MCLCNHWNPLPVCDEPGCKLLALSLGSVAPIQSSTQLTPIPADSIAEKLDELADLAEIWKLHRVKRKNPTGIRAAMTMLCDDIATLAFKREGIHKPDLIAADKAKDKE